MRATGPRLFAASCLVIVAVVLGGCGGSGDSSASANGSNAEASSAGYVNWPQFGRVPARTHYLPEHRRALDPPLKQAWSINTHALIEFPPAIHEGVAYVINKYGNGKAVRLRDRKVLWEINVRPSDKGKPDFVTAPTYYDGAIYGAFLDGDVAAGAAATGKKLWVRKLNAHLESSPLAVDGLLYLGTDTTNLVALDAKTGKTVWSFNSPGAIKASPSYDGGDVFAADYQSSMYALEAKTGKVVWRTNTSKAPPYGRGGFFSSPAVAFGRVYAARDDGTVFALDEKTGKVEWSFPTGDPVYGSPAVAKVPGTPPTVYIGSESGRFYALDARTGKPRWTYDVGGPIPGTATVIGHTVYTTSFKTRETTGLDSRTGKRVFHIEQAGYTPMVSDGKRLFLVSYYSLIGLEPTER
ncbi:MAG TPA: PQQ-binding-like beta-propeller repeat protein [Solirubrobacterales bacterium]|nr:PQQ-binding-like beta-propeller repeat protein [Solirubrobacterales bacterium]